MEKKIENFSKEIFKFAYPELQFSPSELRISVRTGARAAGSFNIFVLETGRETTEKMRGYFVSEDHRLKIEPESFTAKEKEIRFSYNGAGLMAGERREGKLFFISDHGEYSLPFSVEVLPDGIEVGKGQITSLSEFADFAKEDFRSATGLFFEDDFEKILLRDKKEERLLRRGLKLSGNKLHALEQFLVYIGVKEPVKLSVERRSFDCYLAGKPMEDKILIKKNTWGYLRVKISASSSFIELPVTEIGTTDFKGDLFELPFTVKPGAVKGMKSPQWITLKGLPDDIDIRVSLADISGVRGRADRKKYSYIKTVVEEFYNYRMGLKTAEQAAGPMRTALYGFGGGKAGDEFLYINTYLDILTGNREDAKKVLLEKEGETKTPIGAVFHTYLTYLMADESLKSGMKNRMEEVAEKFHCDEAYFFILEMEERFKNSPERRLEILRKLYEGGMNRSVLFLETFLIYHEKPELLTKLDGLSVRAFAKGLRMGFLKNRSLIDRFVFLSGEFRECHPLVLSLLKALYRMEAKEDRLSAICTMLLKGERPQVAENEWFKKGIGKGLKLTGIYESYINTLKGTEEEKIEPSALTYFLYGNSLNYERKALLYAYILRKKSLPEVEEYYKSYKPLITAFALKEIKRGGMSVHHIKIYKEELKNREFIKEAGGSLTKVIFQSMYRVENEKFRDLVVVTGGIKGAKTYRIEEGRAFAAVLGGEVSVFVADEEGLLYPAKFHAVRERLLNYYEYLETCYEAGDRSTFLMHLLFTKGMEGKKAAPDLQICHSLLLYEELLEDYKKKIKLALIRYYSEKKDRIKLDELLNGMELSKLSKEVAEEMCTIAVEKQIYPFYIKALAYMGTERIDTDSLMRVLSDLIGRERTSETSALIAEGGLRLLKENMAKPDLLSVLSEELETSMENLTLLYERLKENELISMGFIKRILEQMLFSEEMSEKAGEIFAYYDGVRRDELDLAFFNYKLYRWLLNDQAPEVALSERIAEEALKADSKLYVLAYLKLLSKKQELGAEEKEFASVKLERFVDEGLILPFYKGFIGKCRVPTEIENISFAAFYADDEDEISIHYRMNTEGRESDGEYRTEWMKNVFKGIFVKEFLIFADEVVQYYISMAKKDGETVLKSDDIRIEMEELLLDEEYTGLYGLINRMFLAKKLDDKKALKDAMKRYVIQKEVAKRVFSSLTLDEDVR